MGKNALENRNLIIDDPPGQFLIYIQMVQKKTLNSGSAMQKMMARIYHTLIKS